MIYINFKHRGESYKIRTKIVKSSGSEMSNSWFNSKIIVQKYKNYYDSQEKIY
jgi:hypothetical protein